MNQKSKLKTIYLTDKKHEIKEQKANKTDNEEHRQISA